MSEVKFYWNSGANIYSGNDSGWIDTKDDLGIDQDDWDAMSDTDKYKEAEIWAWENGLEITYEERD